MFDPMPPALGLSAISTAVAAASLLVVTGARAYDLNEQFSIGGILVATGQCQDVSARLPGADFGQAVPDAHPLAFGNTLERFDNECRGGMPVQVEFDFHPTEHDQFFVALGWALDNGLNEISPWRLAPWAADLEDDVKDINGSSRDYLLQAWYRHGLKLSEETSIAGTFGILDSTAYLDVNEYANDEYTQFMNEAFVNAGNYSLPSYDAGVALEGVFGTFSLNAVGMNINENDDGNNYNFWGMQAGWHPEFKVGAGNYRVNLSGSSSAFLSPSTFTVLAPPAAQAGVEGDLAADDGEGAGSQETVLLVDGQQVLEAPGQREALMSWGLSFDQAIGESFGLFLRMTWQDTAAAVDYEALYSGGVNIAGLAWGRPGDNIGLGYAYLEGGNTDVRRSNVFEGYYRAALNEYLAITADIQHMSDHLNQIDPDQMDPSGWIFGLRVTAAF